MKEKLLENVIDLLKVKSIITILTFVTFIYLSLKNKIDTDNFMLILGMIATYSFSKSSSTKS